MTPKWVVCRIRPTAKGVQRTNSPNQEMELMNPLHRPIFFLLICGLYSLNIQAQVNPLVDSTATKALVFSGTQDEMYLSNAGGLPTGDGDHFTVEAWIKPATEFQSSVVFSKGNGSFSSSQISIGLVEGNPTVWRGNSSIQTSVFIPVGEWSHIAAKYSYDEIKILVNGIELGSESMVQTLGSSQTVANIGGRIVSGDLQDKFVGEIEELRFWQVSRGKGQVNKTKHNVFTEQDPDLICYLQFNEILDGAPLGGDPGSLGFQDASGSYHATADHISIAQSTCPIGAGASHLDYTSQEFVDYTGTQVELQFIPAGSFMAVVNEAVTPPNSWAGIDHIENILDQKHWFLSWFEMDTLSCNVRITGEQVFPSEYHGFPEEFRLMRREPNGVSSWTQVAVGSEMNVAQNSITFNAVLEEGQYAVVLGEPNYPTTKLETGSCGATEVDIRQKLFAEYVASDSMQFVVWNDATGYLDSLTTAGRVLKLRKLPTPVDYSTTYNVKVRGMWSGTFGGFGDVCQVTTDGIPLTQIRPDYCETTQSPGASIYAVGVTGASEYIFEVTDAFGYFEEYSATAAKIRLRELDGPIYFDRAYTIRVRCVVGTDSSEYGFPCDVTTEAWPMTQLRESDCGRTDVHTAWWLKADGVQLVNAYEFEVSHPGTGYLDTYVSPIMKFKLNMLPGTSNTGLTYDIRVRTIISADTSAYGPVCQVTTQSIARMGNYGEDGSDAPNAEPQSDEIAEIDRAYPNPFTTSITLAFTLAIDQSIEIQIYDSMGRMVKEYGRTTLKSGDHNFIWDGTNNRGNQVSPGTYIMTLRNDKDFLVRSERVLLKR